MQKPYSYHIAHQSQLFVLTLNHAANRIMGIMGEVSTLLSDRTLSYELHENLFAKDLSRRRRSAKANGQPPPDHADGTYQDLKVCAKIYNGFIRKGALNTYRDYFANHNDIFLCRYDYETLKNETDQFKRDCQKHAYNQDRIDPVAFCLKNGIHTNLMTTDVIAQSIASKEHYLTERKTNLETFKERYTAASKQIMAYVSPSTPQEHKKLDLIKRDIMTVDFHLGHMCVKANEPKAIKPSAKGSPYSVGKYLFLQDLGLNP